MLKEVTGNLLESGAEALVNTVNTVGVMGKGVALQFKQAFPDNFRAYEAACRRHEVRLGHMLVFRRDSLRALSNPRYIINFPTKAHWRGKSRIKDIEAGLGDLVRVVKEEKIASIAVPPLGCGNGGLDWNQVRPRILSAFSATPEVTVLLYPPSGSPAAEKMRIGTDRPNMTPARAALLILMDKYAMPGYRLTLLEIQKLAYFLQIAGEPLRLSFRKQKYGPYAETLHHVLQRMEGHFISGYGDRSRHASIALKPDAVDEAGKYLAREAETHSRFERIARLIDGFETPYGMELLASVHWVATAEDQAAAIDQDLAVSLVREWNEHKRAVFHPQHIRIAWDRLKEHGWI